MRVFLTGGTGFIGQPLASALRGRGWEVVALVRNLDGEAARPLVGLGARLAPGDVTDRDSMRAAMLGADLVIHNAGMYELGADTATARRMEAINVQGTDNVLGLAAELRIARLVYVSTTQAFGDTGTEELRDEDFVRRSLPATAYERSKTDAHAIACRYQANGLPLTIVCPAGVIGPNDHSIFGYFLRLYLAGWMPPMAWCPDSRLALVEVHDLAEGIALAGEKGRVGETYLLCGASLTLRQHFAIWYQRPGRWRVRLWLPWWLMWVSLWPLEPLERRLGLSAFLSRDTVQAGRTSFHFSSAKAHRELGWTRRSAEAMWLGTIDAELELVQQRARRDLLSRLKPLPADLL